MCIIHANTNFYAGQKGVPAGKVENLKRAIFGRSENYFGLSRTVLSREKLDNREMNFKANYMNRDKCSFLEAHRKKCK